MEIVLDKRVPKVDTRNYRPLVLPSTMLQFDEGPVESRQPSQHWLVRSDGLPEATYDYVLSIPRKNSFIVSDFNGLLQNPELFKLLAAGFNFSALQFKDDGSSSVVNISKYHGGSKPPQK